jgi:hypothetical protein
LDLFEHSPPNVFKLDLAATEALEAYNIVGIFNWTKKELTRAISIELLQLEKDKKYHIFDFWERRYFQIDASHAKVRHLKKSRAKLLIVRPDTGNPQLIASTFHFTSGATEITKFQFDPKTKAIAIEITKAGRNQGHLYLYLPAAYREREVSSNAPKFSMFRHRDGLLTVELRFENQAQITLKLQ